MKHLIFLMVITLNAKLIASLECMGCEITDPSEKCDFFYKCKNGVEMCETLISKVNGNYSIIMACATKEYCGDDHVYNEGLEECKHKK